MNEKYHYYKKLRSAYGMTASEALAFIRKVHRYQHKGFLVCLHYMTGGI